MPASIIWGKSSWAARRRDAEWRRDAFADRLTRARAPDLDQVIVATEEPPAALAQAPDNRPFENGVGRFRGCLVAVAFAPSPRLSYAVACHLRRRQSGDALFAGRSGDCALLYGHGRRWWRR